MSAISAVILLTVERGKANEAAQTLLKLDKVSEVIHVSGQYDLVAIVRTQNNQEIAELITVHISQIQHVLRTETLITFKVYDRDSA